MKRVRSRSSLTRQVITIHQVAQLAGVSTATVSRVLSGSGRVRPELAERVRAAVQELEYQPNRVARDLRMQKTRTIALVVSDIDNPFFTSVVGGAEQVLRAAGYTLILANSDEDEQIEWEHLAELRAEGVAGVILAPTGKDSRKYDQLNESGLLLAAIDRIPHNFRLDRVTVDNVSGIMSAVDHLVEVGHAQIGFIGGLERVSTAQERQRGFEAAMRSHGLEIHPEWMQPGNFRQQGGYQAMKNILSLPERPTAVISANNLMTLGALQAIYEPGLVIPADMAIVGFDDMDWSCALNPPLTAVAQPVRELGADAAELLLNRLANPQAPPRHVILETRLVVRQSSGPHGAPR